MIKKILYAATLITLLFTTPIITMSFASSNPESSQQSELVSEAPVRATLLQEEDSIQPGRPFWVAIQLDLEKEWHIYWKNPGDVGVPVSVHWNLPKGFEASDIEWPVPKRFDMGSIIGYGYDHQVTFLVKITPDKNISLSSDIEIGADLQWLACSDSTCLPGDTQVRITIPVTTTTPKALNDSASLFEKAHSKLPKKEWGTLTACRKAESLEVVLAAPEGRAKAAGIYFCPEEQDVIHAATTPSVTPSSSEQQEYVVALKNDQLKKTTNLKGVLVFHEPEDQNDIIAAVDVNVLINESTSISLLKETSSSNLEGLWFYVLTAFLGGLILNCMPCVLPVISLKIMSFVNMAGESRSKTFKHGLVFSIGVLMSFWVLAGALLTLQAYGHLVGWGFQLQNALFVGTLAIVIFIFSLSLFGIFEFGAVFASWAGKGQVKTNKTGSESVTGSFFSGILATAVATPCTGPFLGSAIGFAVTQPPLWALIVFTSLGLGMASPYLILAAFPSLLRFIPKPGNWMVTFKEISGFIMLATVIWLLWVFTAQTSHYSLFIMMGALFLFAIGCWVSGKWASPVKKQRIRVIGTSLALIFFAFGGVLAYEAATVEEMNETEWEVFSPERLAQLRTEGTPVFVDFTAKWCLICQQNHLVLSNDRVAKKFKELGVVRMKADWTKHDPTITNTLRLFGRNGVPLYIVYNGNTHQDAEVLPQVLTPDLVIAQLDKLEPAKK